MCVSLYVCMYVYMCVCVCVYACFVSAMHFDKITLYMCVFLTRSMTMLSLPVWQMRYILHHVYPRAPLDPRFAYHDEPTPLKVGLYPTFSMFMLWLPSACVLYEAGVYAKTFHSLSFECLRTWCDEARV